MANVAPFVPRDRGSNPSWFAVSNSNQKLSFTNNTRMWYSSKFFNLVMGGTLEGGDKEPLKFI